MTRVHQGASLIIIAFAVWVMVTAQGLTYWTSLGPGPGFFPFWLAVFVAVLAGIWFVQLVLKPVEGKAADFVPARANLLRIVALVVSVALFGLLIEEVGFSVLMFAFLLFLLTALGRQNIVLTLIISLVGSFGLYYVFTQYLNVQLPESSIEFVRDLGF